MPSGYPATATPGQSLPGVPPTSWRSRRDPSGEGGAEQRPGDLLGLLGRRGTHRLRLVAVLVASTSQAVELSRRPVRGRLVEDRTQIAAERLVLAGPVGVRKPYAASSASPVS